MEVILFPRKDYDVTICSHRLGKSMTYTEQTDTLRLDDSYDWMLGLAKDRGIKVGAFAYKDDFSASNFIKAKNDFNNGALWLDEYSLCDSLSSKIIGGGTITEEEWRNAYNNELLPPFLSTMGVKPIALSYSYGNESFKNYLSQYLGARNSAYNVATSYGLGFGNPNNVAYSKSEYVSRQGTSRWYDKGKTQTSFSTELSVMSALIDATKINGGWINNFTHWHNVVADNNQSVYVQYMDMLQSKNADNSIYFAGYGEALAYMVYRDMITKAVMYSPKMSPNTLVIRLETSNMFGVDTELLQIPISVKFSTNGTPLQGTTIKADCNLIPLGGDEYIVEIPFSRFPSAEITIG